MKTTCVSCIDNIPCTFGDYFCAAEHLHSCVPPSTATITTSVKGGKHKMLPQCSLRLAAFRRCVGTRRLLPFLL